MPEVILLSLIIGAVIIILVVMLISDYQRQKLKISSGRYEERIRELEDRVAELEMENIRLLDQLKIQGRLPGRGQTQQN